MEEVLTESEIAAGVTLNDKYTSTSSVSGNSTSVTNTHTPEKISVKITKDWVGRTNDGDTVKVRLNNAFYLKHGESTTITGIPANAVVQVMEETGAYTAAWSGSNGVNPSAPTVVTEGTRSSSVTLTMSASAKLTVTNSLTAPVETGIDLDVAPYVTLLLLLGAAAWLARRRRGEGDVDA